MNLFILDLNFEKCAQYHCDKHVVKMILETTQLLYTAHWQNNADNAWTRRADVQPVYRPVSINHPCAKWVRECKANYMLAAKLGLALCSEYFFRFEKSSHKCLPHLQWLSNNCPPFKKGASKIQTPFALAMPEAYRVDPDDAVKCYRIYYIHEKYRIATYRKRPFPEWLNTPPHIVIPEVSSKSEKTIVKSRKSTSVVEKKIRTRVRKPVNSPVNTT